MKKLLIVLLLACTIVLMYSQGLFRPVPDNLFTNSEDGVRTVVLTHAWIPRISASVIANQFTYNKETKNLDMSSFSKVGLGISYAHFIPIDELPYNNYSLNAFIFFPVVEPESGLALAVTISTLKFINVGIGYDTGVKKMFALTGVQYSF